MENIMGVPRHWIAYERVFPTRCHRKFKHVLVDVRIRLSTFDQTLLPRTGVGEFWTRDFWRMESIIVFLLKYIIIHG
jgi:hypothetical protein